MQVERRILDEERNTALFLPDHMKFSILRTCEKILITDHLDLYFNSFTELLPLHDHSKLGQVYKLLARVPNGLDTCTESFEKHVRQAGLKAVEDAVASTTKQGEMKDRGEAVDHNLFSESLSSVIKKYQALVKLAFNSDKELNRSVDRASRAFVNWNRACIYDSDAPELLARHTESLLRQRSGRAVSEPDILDKLDDSV
jgi:cullin 1